MLLTENIQVKSKFFTRNKSDYPIPTPHPDFTGNKWLHESEGYQINQDYPLSEPHYSPYRLETNWGKIISGGL